MIYEPSQSAIVGIRKNVPSPDYSSIEIENADSLEVIEMGEFNEWSGNFYSASLELKSVYDGLR